MPANQRFRRRGRRVRYSENLEPNNRFARHAIYYGRELLRMPDTVDLRDDVEEWAEVWERHRGYLLPEWIEGCPGMRPQVWWRFDCPDTPKRRRDESSVDYLDRLGVLSDEELDGMWAVLLDKLKHNACDSWLERRNGQASNQRFRGDDGDQPYDELDRYAIAHPIDGLSEEEEELVERFRLAILATAIDDSGDDSEF